MWHDFNLSRILKFIMQQSRGSNIAVGRHCSKSFLSASSSKRCSVNILGHRISTITVHLQRLGKIWRKLRKKKKVHCIFEARSTLLVKQRTIDHILVPSHQHTFSSLICSAPHVHSLCCPRGPSLPGRAVWAKLQTVLIVLNSSKITVVARKLSAPAFP